MNQKLSSRRRLISTTAVILPRSGSRVSVHHGVRLNRCLRHSINRMAPRTIRNHGSHLQPLCLLRPGKWAVDSRSPTICRKSKTQSASSQRGLDYLDLQSVLLRFKIRSAEMGTFRSKSRRERLRGRFNKAEPLWFPPVTADQGSGIQINLPPSEAVWLPSR